MTAERHAPPPGSPIAIREQHSRIVQLAGEAYEVRSLTSEERAAFRRRVNFIAFVATAAVLAVAVVALLLWRG
jgi:hypothetical protein